MSRLEAMLKEMCPNGVEYKKVGELCKIETGKLNANAASENGKYAFFTTAEKISRTNTYGWNTEALLVAGNANVGDVKHYIGKFDAYQRTYVLTGFAPIVKAKYIYYYMKNSLKNYLKNQKQVAAITYIRLDQLQNFEIPVPPIEIQREIVRILDAFTAMKAELSAELSERKKQYEYYRDKLLNFSEESVNPIVNELLKKYCPCGMKYSPLKEVGTNFFRGNGIKRTDITKDGIPCVRYGEIYTKYGVWFDKCISHTTISATTSPKFFENGAILFAITGENVKDIAKCTAYLGHERCLAGGDIVVMEHNEDPKYLSYVLSTTDAVIQKGVGKVKSKVVHSSIPEIMDIVIPVPPLEIQREIVRILDHYNSLCNDLENGLPAEIAARQKQYEYYRDILLSFERVS